MTSVLIGIVAIVVAMLVVAVRRGLQMKRLAVEGQPVQGRVDKLWGHTVSTGSKTHRLRYSFELAGGHRFQRTVVVAPGEREALTEGAPVALVYLPDNPNISALADVVAQARQALERR